MLFAATDPAPDAAGASGLSWPGRRESQQRAIERVFREERGRILATLIRLLGDFDLAEEALAGGVRGGAGAVAARGHAREPARLADPRGAQQGDRPAAAARAVRGRSRRRWRPRRRCEREDDRARVRRRGAVHDDRLRLIFTCCHPALAVEAQVALTLRTLCGLDDRGDRARVPGAGADDGAAAGAREGEDPRRRASPTACPTPRICPSALDAVLAVVYLVFNEGYAASAGDALVRRELCAEAIRLGRLLRRAAAARDRGARAAGADAAARRAPRRARGRRRRDRAAGGAGPRALGSRRRSPRGWRWSRRALRARAAGRLRPAGGDRRRCTRARRAPPTPTGARSRRSTRLLRGRHPSPVVALNHAVGGRDGRRAGRRAAADGRARRRRRARRLPPAAGRARRSAAPARAAGARRPPPTARRWRWSATKPTGVSSSARPRAEVAARAQLSAALDA